MSTKEKVDVKAIMARAKDKVKTVKASSEKIDAKKDTYRLVPGFKKYEFNGIILRNFETKNIISFKTGRTKYQLKDDKGKSHNLSKEDIKALMPSEKNSEVKPKKEKAEKPVKEKKVLTVLAHVAPKESVEEILAMECKNNRKIYLLHLKGLSNTEIHEKIKSPIPTIARDIWRFRTGVTTF